LKMPSRNVIIFRGMRGHTAASVLKTFRGRSCTGGRARTDERGEAVSFTAARAPCLSVSPVRRASAALFPPFILPALCLTPTHSKEAKRPLSGNLFAARHGKTSGENIRKTRLRPHRTTGGGSAGRKGLIVFQSHSQPAGLAHLFVCPFSPFRISLHSKTDCERNAPVPRYLVE